MPGESRKYGTTIASSLYSPIHQHFFVSRMDMAVDSVHAEARNQVELECKLTLHAYGSIVCALYQLSTHHGD